MRIGIDTRSISHSQRGGFQTYTTELIRALSTLDHENEYILYFDRPFTPPFALPDNFCVRQIPAEPKMIGTVWREQKRLPAQLAQDGVDLAHYPCNTAPILSPASPSALTLHDVIALTDPQAVQKLSPSQMWQWLIAKYATTVIPKAVERAGAIITVSHFEKEEIRAVFEIPAHKIFVTPLAVNPNLRPLTCEERNEQGGKVLANLGIDRPFLFALGYEPRKNMAGVIQAYRILHETHCDAKLVAVIGHVATRLKWQKYITEIGLDESVVLLGGVSQQELIFLYNLAEAFLFPSFREGFGLPPLEAMACGTPVIVSDRSSLPEVVGDAALIVDPNEPCQIADACMRVLADTALKSELSAKGLRRVQKFSWAETARLTLNAYHAAVQ
ncbi:MAG: glycosyltransferase family 4 protein [Caldilineaceae bacterium]|nr:glycosyltransferase family 4 protein [Caldilineaceae bacterium]